MDMEAFPTVRLTPARRAQLDRSCDDLIERAVDAHEHLRLSPSALDSWRLVRRKGGLGIYRSRSPSSDAPPGAPHLLMGTGAFPGTVDDAIAGTYSDSTESLRCSKALLSDKFIDGAVLEVLVANPPTSGVIFAGVKWFALRAPKCGQLIRDRDLLTYERQGRIVDRAGRFFAYHVYQSIELPEWPSSRDPSLTRAFMSMCYLYSLADDPGFVDCFMLGRFHPGGAIPSSLGAFVAADRMLSVVNCVLCAQAKRFSRLAARAAERCVPSESLYRCDVCSALTSTAGCGTADCLGCRRRACKRCSTRRPLFRLHPRTQRPVRGVFCRECVDLVARASGGVGAFDTSSADESTDRSGSSGHDANEFYSKMELPHNVPQRRSSFDDAELKSVRDQWGQTRQRAGTDARPPVAAGADDNATRAGRSHSLLFDAERGMYIRVFGATASGAQPPPPAPAPAQQPKPMKQQPPTRPKSHSRPQPRRTDTLGVRVHVGGERAQPRDRVFSVDALD